MAQWQVWLDDPTGNRLALLDGLLGLSVSMIANDIGAFEVVLPEDFDASLIRLDSLIEFWRAPEGGTFRLVRVGMVRKWVYSEDDDGNEFLIISGPDQMELLNRRIVGYAAGTGPTSKNTEADDLIKAVARENLGSSATAARDLSSFNFTVAPDLSLGPVIERKFAWQTVMTVLQAAADASGQAGTDLYFDLNPVLVSETQLGFDLRTYINQIGMDVSASIFFGKEWGNLANPKLEQDYSEEINYVYVGGQGEGSDRNTLERQDAARIGVSPWNRREVFVDARNETSTAGLTAKGDAALQASRPRLRFSGALLDTEQTRYGIDWQFGDKVTVEYRGFQFGGMIRAVRLELNDDGDETVDCKVETEVS